MASHAAVPPSPPPPPHGCSQEDILVAINSKLDAIIERLGKGDTALALLEHRLAFIERIVYGLCGFILLSVLTGIVALVVKSSP